MLTCLNANRCCFSKGQMVCRTGDVVASPGLVLSGSVLIENDDVWGNTTVLESVGPEHIFAEAYACPPGEQLMSTVSGWS